MVPTVIHYCLANLPISQLFKLNHVISVQLRYVALYMP